MQKIELQTALGYLLTISLFLLTTASLADSETEAASGAQMSTKTESSNAAAEQKPSSVTTQRQLARIVAILRYEARLAAQEVAKENELARHKTRLEAQEINRERAKERYESALASHDLAEERSKERYESELVTQDVADERSKERYESELATQEIAKERAKKRYESELATIDIAGERSTERYEGELAAHETARERANERHEGELAALNIARERSKEYYEGELAALDIAKERYMAQVQEEADNYDQNALRLAVFEALDSNGDFELSRVEFETGMKILDALRLQNYPGLNGNESTQVASGKESEENDRFENMDTNEDGVLSQAEFIWTAERFL